MLDLKMFLRYKSTVFIANMLLLMWIAFSCRHEPEVVPVDISPLDSVVVIEPNNEDTVQVNLLMDSVIGTHSGKCRYQYKNNYYANDTLITTMIDTTDGNSVITIMRLNDQTARADGCGWSPDYTFSYPLGSTQTKFEGTWVQGSRLSTITIDLMERTITTTQRYDPVSTASHKWQGQWRF